MPVEYIISSTSYYGMPQYCALTADKLHGAVGPVSQKLKRSWPLGKIKHLIRSICVSLTNWCLLSENWMYIATQGSGTENTSGSVNSNSCDS